MSIKRYLFILIGGIVLVVAALQMLLLTFYKQHLNQEIVEKSQRLSTQIIDFAVENVDLDENILILESKKPKAESEKATHILKTKLSSEAVKAGCVIIETKNTETESGNDSFKTSLNVQCKESPSELEIQGAHQETAQENVRKRFISEEELRQEKLRWKKKLHKIISDKHQGQVAVQEIAFVTNSTSPLIGQHKFGSSTPPSNTIETLVEYMFYLILGSSILALLLALWLSNHFTQPLQNLSKGFQALESGDFGIQVDVSGINEYRKTISSFNQMSLRLAQLAENEKLLQQQGHLAELGEVSRGLAHALRNPMHTIGLSVEQLKDASLPEKLRVKLQDKIQNKIKHIDKTIKALLTLTSGEIQRNEDVPIRSVIQDIILEMKANDPVITIKFNSLQNNILVKGAESELRAIIHTLIVNAVEASTDNKGEITITLGEDNRNIEIEVLDQGSGINQSIADKLFAPHVSTKTEGAGMGLYISRRLATLYYNGEITLENRESGGCRAIVRLQKDRSNA